MMNADPDSFRCKALDKSMPFKRCVRNQRQAEEFFGPGPPKKESCHLCAQGQAIREKMANTPINEQKKGVEMASVKKICRNCGREKSIQQDGLCGGCNGAVLRSGTKRGTPECDEVLARAKEKLTGKAPTENIKAKSETKPAGPETKQPEKETKAIRDAVNKWPVKIQGGDQVIPVTLRLNIEVCLKVAAIG